jgi:hypothetical protein
MIEKFEPQHYAPAVAELLAPQRLAVLGPGEPNLPVHDRLAEISDRELFAGREVVDCQMADACRAGLWLYHDFLDQSHQVSQVIDTPTGSFWHGIMHRREPDFANANYWFRRVGRHPIFGRLAEAAGRISHEQAGLFPRGHGLPNDTESWDCQAFTEMCRRVQQSPANAGAMLLLRHVQQAEWELLFDYCYHAAIGDTASAAG